MMEHSFILTKDLIESLQELDNKFAKAFVDLQQSSPQELESLHRYAKVSMIGSSTRIENALLTDVEINWIDTILTDDGKLTAFDQNRMLIENKLSKDRERSIEEVAGCRAMLLLIYSNPNDFHPLKENDLRALHYELLSPYKKSRIYAGKYKLQTNSVIERNHISNKTRLVFQTADPGPITAAAMNDLIEWYNATLSYSAWSVAIASELVYRFLAIHPFQDGNGRLGRAIFLMSLLNSKSEVISYVSKYIAIDRYIEKYKEEYYSVLNRCSDGKFKEDSKDYKTQFFVKFMIKVLNEALDGIEIYKNKFSAEQKLPSAASVVLSCFRDSPEIRLTTAKLIEETSFPRRTIVYSLNKLLDAQLVQKYGQGPSTKYQLVF
jgi:Fic family protein